MLASSASVLASIASYMHELSRILSATMSKVWFITGAGSGIGSGTAKAA